MRCVLPASCCHLLAGGWAAATPLSLMNVTLVRVAKHSCASDVAEFTASAMHTRLTVGVQQASVTMCGMASRHCGLPANFKLAAANVCTLLHPDACKPANVYQWTE
jgi:hypothetical protein